MLRTIKKANITVKSIGSAVQLYCQPIFLENPWASFAALAAIPIAFSADWLATDNDLFGLLPKDDEFEGTSYLIAFVIVLIIYLVGVLSETRKFIFYNRACINLPIVVNIDNKANSTDILKTFAHALTEKLDVSHRYLYELERYLTIASEDLIFQHSLNINNPDELHDVFAVIRHNLTRLQSQTPKDHTLEIAYIGPIAIGIWLGAITRTEAIALWPYNRGTAPSYPERIAVPDNIQWASVGESQQKTQRELLCPNPANTQTWLVALDLAGERRLSSQQLTAQGFDNCLYICGMDDVVEIKSNEYIQYAQEIYSEISVLKREYSPSSIRLISCVPNILAILMGRMLGTMFPIEVAHYENGAYSVLFKLNDPRFRYKHIA
ncbi:MAG: SAVED domain-containing protein [Spirulinaceae cyanobacterium]